MKLIYKTLPALLATIFLIYSGCKKTQDKPSTQPVNLEALSSQIALNLAQSLNGSFGGASIKDGLNGPSNMGASGSRLTVNTVVGCGFLIDTGINYNTNIGDTIKSNTKGSIIYRYTCSNGAAIGYTVTDTLVTTGTAPGYTFNYNITQDYVVTGLNPGSPVVSLSGSLKTVVDFTYPNPKNNQHTDNAFVLTNLQIDPSDSYDVASGSATFVTRGHNSAGSWEFVGNIVFLGNHKAKVIFNGKSFNVDLINGTVTAG